jgi:hypothetical protein
MALEGDFPKESTHVNLVFPYFWRDFRSLRGVSDKHGLSRYHVTFRFPQDQATSIAGTTHLCNNSIDTTSV